MKPRKKTSIILLITLCLSIFGFHRGSQIPESLEPEVESNLASIFIATPGLSVNYIEREVIATLEQELRSLPSVKSMYSSAHIDYAVISMELERGGLSDYRWQQRCDTVLQMWRAKYRSYHPYVSDPILTMDSQIGYDCILLVPNSKLKEIERDLVSQAEVKDVKVSAHPKREILVEFNNEDLDAAKLHPLEIKEAIIANNVRIPGGFTHEKGRLYSVESESALQSIDELRALEVRDPKNNDPTALEDLVKITETNGSKYEPEVYYEDRQHSVLCIRKKAEVKANHFNVLTNEIAAKHGAVIFLESNSTIEDQKQAIVKGAICSMIIVFIILALTIGVREGFIISLSIPLVIGVSSFFISFTVVTLNIISLAAVILSLSLIIDGHIVVLDASNRKKRTVMELIRRFGNVLVVSALTTMISFSPIYFADHALADYLGSMFIVLLITLLVSLFYSCLVTPYLAKYRREQTDSKLLNFLSKKHLILLEKVMARKVYVLVIIGLMLSLGTVAISWVPRAFFPEQKRDYKVLSILCEKPRTNSELKLIAKEISTALSLEKSQYFLGMEAPNLSAFQPSEVHDMRLINVIVPNDVSMDKYNEIQKKYTDFQFELHQAKVGPRMKYPLGLEITGDAKMIENFLTDLSVEINGDEGIKHLVSSKHQMLSSYNVMINPDNEGDFSRQDVALAINLNTQGVPITHLMVDGEAIATILKAEANHPNPKSSLENCYVFSKNKKVAALIMHEIATLEKRKSAQYALHKNGESVAQASFYLNEGADAKESLAELEGVLDGLQVKHPELTIKIDGQLEATRKATSAITNILPWVISLLIILLLLKEWSIKRVAIILSVLPFALAGGATGLLVCGQAQGFISLVGIVSLFGIVVNNAMLWLDALHRDQSSKNSYVEATKERFRAITVTSLSSIATLIPLYWFGGEIWQPLASTLIFGLIFSYLSIVLILPVIAETFAVKNTKEA